MILKGVIMRLFIMINLPDCSSDCRLPIFVTIFVGDVGAFSFVIIFARFFVGLVEVGESPDRNELLFDFVLFGREIFGEESSTADSTSELSLFDGAGEIFRNRTIIGDF